MFCVHHCVLYAMEMEMNILQCLFKLTCDLKSTTVNVLRVEAMFSLFCSNTRFDLCLYEELKYPETKRAVGLWGTFSFIISNHMLPRLCHCFKLWLFGVLVFFCQCENWFCGIVYCCCFCVFFLPPPRKYLSSVEAMEA